MAKITKTSDNVIKICEYYECGGDITKYLKAYLCPANVITIGLGTTVYPNGQKVKLGDVCSTEQAYEYFRHDISWFEIQVDSYCIDTINQNQFDALVDFCYNCGIGNLKISTLLKKVNVNPNDPSIPVEFEKWNKADGTHNKKDDDGDGLIDEAGELQVLQGLARRRTTEGTLYSTGQLYYPPIK